MSHSLRLHAPTPLEYFATLVGDDAGLNLLEAAAAIAQDEFPALDVQAVLAEVDSLAERLRQRLPADASAGHKLRSLTRYFHQELGFAGNINNYYERGNSYIHHVLATRRGIPITLAVIFLELATQLGLRAQGILPRSCRMTSTNSSCGSAIEVAPSRPIIVLLATMESMIASSVASMTAS